MGEHNKGFIKGTAIGMVLGGIAALLLAPKSGKETQADLKKHAKKVMKDMDDRLAEVEVQLEDRIDGLKAAARDLKGEAYEDSQRLITKAEILKHDLQDSASQMSRAGKVAKEDAVHDVKRLVGEGAVVMSELERMTKRIIDSAKEKAADEPKSKQEE